MPRTLEPLIAAAQLGDREAVNALCADLYPRVQEMVHQALGRDLRRGRPWLAAMFSTGDVVQELFLGVIRDLGEIRGRTDDALIGYIATLTRNRLVDAIRYYEASRRDGRRQEPLPGTVNLASQGSSDPAQLAIDAEEIGRFHDAIAAFPERERTLLRERLEDRRPFAELAPILGYASADSARKAFHHAQAKLLMRLRTRPT